jgi:hypothetical protein
MYILEEGVMRPFIFIGISLAFLTTDMCLADSVRCPTGVHPECTQFRKPEQTCARDECRVYVGQADQAGICSWDCAKSFEAARDHGLSLPEALEAMKKVAPKQ